MIYITLDIDWAPDFVIAYTLDLLSSLGIPATIFATHQTNVLTNLQESFEIGLHPNYLPMHDGNGFDYKAETLRLLETYPDAKGVRSHGIVQSAKLHKFWKDSGFTYESNQYFPFSIPFFKDYNGLVRCHVYWGDNIPLISGAGRLLLANDEYPKVLVFHPIHLFINTFSLKHYEMSKKNRDKESLEQCVNKEVYGIKDTLYQCINQAEKTGVQFGLLKDAKYDIKY